MYNGKEVGNEIVSSKLDQTAKSNYHGCTTSLKVASVALTELAHAHVTEKEILEHSRKDPLLSLVVRLVLEGTWDAESENVSMRPYLSRLGQ